MKKLQLITVMMCFASLSFVLQAQKTGTNNVTQLIKSLDNDVQLSDSQKVVLTQRYTLMHNKVNSEKSDKSVRNKAFKSFQFSIDSILTSEQKEKLTDARRERAIKAFESSEKNKK